MYDLNAGIAAVQIKAVDIVSELAPADGIRCDKQSPDPEQDVGISVDTRFNGVLRVGDGAFEFQPGLVLHLVCRPIRSGGRQDDADGEHHQRCRSVAGDMG